MKKIFKLFILPILLICGCSKSEDKIPTLNITPDDKLIVHSQDGKELKLTPASQGIQTEQYVVSAYELKDYTDYFTVEFKLAKTFFVNDEINYTWATRSEEAEFYKTNEKQGIETYSKPFFAYRYTDGNSYVLENETELVFKTTELIEAGTIDLRPHTKLTTVSKEAVEGINFVTRDKINFYKAKYTIPKGVILTYDYLVGIDEDIGTGQEQTVSEFVYFPISVKSSSTTDGYLQVGQFVDIYGTKTVIDSTGTSQTVNGRIVTNAKMVEILSGSFQGGGTATCTFYLRKTQLNNLVSYVNGGGTLFFQNKDFRYDDWKGEGKNVDFKKRHIASAETFFVMEAADWEEYINVPQYLIFVYEAEETESENLKYEILEYIDTCDFLIFLTRETGQYKISTETSLEKQSEDAYTSIGATSVSEITIGRKPTLICISNNYSTGERQVTSIYTGIEQIRMILQTNS